MELTENSNSRPSGIRSGLVWYAAVLPLLGLFLENFAMNKYHGFMIWGIVLFMRPLCCLLDRRVLREAGTDTGPAALALLPTVYLFKRCFALRHNNAIVIVCLISFSYGVIGNGFTLGLTLDEDRLLNAVRNQSVTSIEPLKKETADESISDALERTCDSISWEMTRSGDVRTVTASAVQKTTGDKLVLTFSVTHDGFTYLDYSFESVTKNGEQLKGDDEKELLKAILLADS